MYSLIDMRPVHTLFLLAFVLLSGCLAGPAENQAGTKTLTIFAAASLTDAFEALAAEFEAANPDINIIFNFAGSSQLAVQLENGANADLFASANELQMVRVQNEGLIDAAQTTTFTTNRLAIVTIPEKAGEIQSLEDLAQPGLSLILAIEGVPIRAYSDEVLSQLPDDLQTDIYANLVSEEDNVRRVVAKIALGEADAGIVYLSDVTPDLAADLHVVDIPSSQNVAAPYPIGRLNNSPHPSEADRLITFLLSPTGQSILATWGFQPVEG